MSALKASNYPDIMTAINSMADGDSMEIDANVPFPCTDTGTAWAGFNYCCRPNARGIEIWGHDDASIIDMQNYNPSMAILLNGVIGADAYLHNFKIRAPLTDHTHQGPFGINIGNMAGDDTAGKLINVTIKNIIMENVAFAVGGLGAENVDIENISGFCQGGLPYSSGNYSEVFDIGSLPADLTLTGGHVIKAIQSFTLKNCTIAPDFIYGDHFLYLLGPMPNVNIENNHIPSCPHAVFKFYCNNGNAYGRLFANNNSCGPSTEGFYFFDVAGTCTCESAELNNGKSGLTGYGLYSDWSFNELRVDGLDIDDCESPVYMEVGSSGASGTAWLKNIRCQEFNSAGTLGEAAVSIASMNKIWVSNCKFDSVNKLNSIINISNATEHLESSIDSTLNEGDNMAVDHDNTPRTPCNFFKVVFTAQDGSTLTNGKEYISYAYERISGTDWVYIIDDTGASQIVYVNAINKTNGVTLTVVSPYSGA